MNHSVTIIGLGFVNAYLVASDGEFILIDSGLPFQRDLLESKLRTAGCVPGKLRLIVVTHGDWDHIGNCAYLQKEYGAKIAMHADDAFMAKGGAVLKRRITTLSRRISYTMVKILRRLKKISSTTEAFVPDIFLSGSEDLSTYGFTARVVHIPGHTKGSIGILADNGDFFSGDTLINRKKPCSAEFVQDDAALKQSLRIISVLPVKTVYPGHGKPFTAAEFFGR